MKFELGKCYKHHCGSAMHILAKVETVIYGECFIAEESHGGYFKPVGMDETSAENWEEITYDTFFNIMVGDTATICRCPLCNRAVSCPLCNGAVKSYTDVYAEPATVTFFECTVCHFRTPKYPQKNCAVLKENG